MKKVIITSILISLTLLTVAPLHSKEIILQSQLLENVDGLRIGINGTVIGVLVKVARQIKKMQFGAKQKDGTRVGLYTYKGKKLTIKQLVEIEKTEKMHSTLKKCYNVVKDDFLRKVQPFFAEARETKSIMVKLIENSCSQRNRMNSVLLTWVEVDGEGEEEVFHQQLTSFKDFHIFCSDIVNFLNDLVNSCPKARKQFEKIMAAKQASR